jgi:hypothetical protein
VSTRDKGKGLCSGKQANLLHIHTRIGIVVSGRLQLLRLYDSFVELEEVRWLARACPSLRGLMLDVGVYTWIQIYGNDIESRLFLGEESGKAFHEYRANLLRLGRELAQEGVHFRLEPLDAI